MNCPWRSASTAVSGTASGVTPFTGTPTTSSTRSFTARVQGTLNDRPAPLPARIRPGSTGLNPFDRIVIDFSERLRSDAKLFSQVDGSDVPVAIRLESMGESLFFSEEKLLPFGARLKVVFEPALRDLAGNIAEPSAQSLLLGTVADPPVLAQDGFESAGPPGPAPVTLGEIVGDVALVSAEQVPGITLREPGAVRRSWHGAGIQRGRRALHRPGGTTHGG